MRLRFMTLAKLAIRVRTGGIEITQCNETQTIGRGIVV